MTSAASIAISAPAPIAKLTSAAASAGASLTPSPTMPTTTPVPAISRTASALAEGSTPDSNFVDADSERDGLRRGAVVAGEHDDVHTDVREAPHGVA